MADASTDQYSDNEVKIVLRNNTWPLNSEEVSRDVGQNNFQGRLEGVEADNAYPPQMNVEEAEQILCEAKNSLGVDTAKSKESAGAGNWKSYVERILPDFGSAPAAASNTATAELDDDDDEARSAAGSGFLGGFWDFFGIPENLGFFGIFWDFARLLEYSDIFYVSLRRFWMLLLRALVTHTYNTYERLFRHGDVYKCFFFASL